VYGNKQQMASIPFSVSNSSPGNPSARINIDQPNSNSPPLQGSATISGWAINTTNSSYYVQLYVDDFFLGTVFPNISRGDVCAVYPSAKNCPNVGWSYVLDTSQYLDGAHKLTVVGAPYGAITEASVPIVISNSGILNPVHVNIDYYGTAALSGTANFAGWAVSDNSAISSVAVTIDGNSAGSASYGDSRGDVCLVYVNRLGCPNVGWHVAVDTTKLSNGSHTLSATGTSSLGQQAMQSTTFTVKN
jgi:hypothetical protein